MKCLSDARSLASLTEADAVAAQHIRTRAMAKKSIEVSTLEE